MGSKAKTNIDALLMDWARWKWRENSQGGGYPQICAFARMRVDGARSGDPHALMIDDDLRRVDVVINGLRPELKRVLVCHFLQHGRGKDKAVLLKISQREYYDKVRAAILQVAHEMGGRYALEDDAEFVPLQGRSSPKAGWRGKNSATGAI